MQKHAQQMQNQKRHSYHEKQQHSSSNFVSVRSNHRSQWCPSTQQDSAESGSGYGVYPTRVDKAGDAQGLNIPPERDGPGITANITHEALFDQILRFTTALEIRGSTENEVIIFLQSLNI